MHLAFTFANNLPSFETDIDVMQATPIELLVSAEIGSAKMREEALRGYIRTLDYLFRGITNIATGNILGASVGKSWFGTMEKQGDAVSWKAVVDKLFLVVYDIKLTSLNEHMYVADAISYNQSNPRDVKPVWVKELLDPLSKSGNAPEDHIRHAISVVTEYVDDYSLVYGRLGRDVLSIIDNKTNKSIDVQDVGSDEAYIIIQLLSNLLTKGLHHGVFLVDARGFSDRALQALTEIARLFFGDTFFFVYNVSPRSRLHRIPVTLPNYFVTR